MNSANGHEWLTPAETADLLRVHKRTIYDACAAGELPHVRIGRAIRIPRRALQRAAVGLDRGRGDDPTGEPGRRLDLITRDDDEVTGDGIRAV